MGAVGRAGYSQGLVVCRQCGYASYGKMARSVVGGRKPADCGYYRCTGTDAHNSAARRFAVIAQCAPTSSKQLCGIRLRRCWPTLNVSQWNMSGVSQRPRTARQVEGSTPWIGRWHDYAAGLTG